MAKPAGCSDELYQRLMAQGVRDCDKCLSQAVAKFLSGEQAEIYSFQTDDGNLYAWDVCAILTFLASAPIEPHPLNQDQFENLYKNQLCRSHIIPEHLDHVDPAEPGLSVFVDGRAILIDGNHRCMRAWRDRLPVSIRFLPVEVSDRFLLCKPPQTREDLAQITKARALILLQAKGCSQ